MNQLIQDDLLNDETILWSGRPDYTKLFSRVDLFLIPFSLLWLGFALFWEYTAISEGFVPFILFGLIFLIYGLVFIFGRFFYKHYIRKNTYY